MGRAYLLKAGNTGKKGGQYRNRNAAKNTEPYEDYDTNDFGSVLDNYNLMRSQWESDITPEQREAVQDYSHGAYELANKFLRNGEIADDYRVEDMSPEMQHAYVERYVSRISAAMRPLEKGLVVYRGTYSQPTKYAVNGVLKDKGFVSTSLDPTVMDMRNYDSITKIRVPKGTSVAYGLYSGLPEREIILPANSKFKFTGETISSRGHKMLTADFIK